MPLYFTTLIDNNPWINIKERLPDCAGHYLCSNGFKVYLGWYECRIGIYWREAETMNTLKPTHWKYLSMPPNFEDEE